MIFVEFEEPETAEWIAWRQECLMATEELIRSYQPGATVEITDLYKGQKREVYFNDDYPFYGKCAYCEDEIIRSQPGDVEHFRPKKGVQDINKRKVRISIAGQEIDHPGYFWLAYDWRNLLPSCANCNRLNTSSNETVGKGNRFPVRNDAYATQPGEETNEDALLINPLATDPSTHIEIDNIGLLHHLTDEGEISIALFGLNLRSLPKGRKIRYNNMKMIYNKYILYILEKNAEKTEEFKQHIDIVNRGGGEFAIAARKAIEESKRILRNEIQE